VRKRAPMAVQHGRYSSGNAAAQAGAARSIETATMTLRRAPTDDVGLRCQQATTTRRDGEASRGAPARGLQFGSTLADPVLVDDRVPACPATLAGPSEPAGGFQLSEKVEYLVAVPAGLLGARRGGESTVVG
jgi:hypothetical protein